MVNAKREKYKARYRTAIPHAIGTRYKMKQKTCLGEGCRIRQLPCLLVKGEKAKEGTSSCIHDDVDLGCEVLREQLPC